MVRTAGNSNVISKAFAVLRAFTDKKMEWGVNELARYMDIPVSSLHRILTHLKDEGLLQISPVTNKYKVGYELIRMSSIISAQVDLKSLSRPFLKKISSAVNESVYLGLYYSQFKKLAFVEGVHSQNPLQYVLEIGVLQPIHIAASGKVILAHLNKNEVASIFEEEGIDGEEAKKVRSELEKVRKQDYLMTAGERLPGAIGIASPLYDASQQVIGCITCVIPIRHFKQEQEEMISQQVREGALKISQSLGYCC
ncbi:IclR family transcriptional regulator [Scopulibacillus cellulosilyticus]|uniref:IclR family transcriptional regulator n=1 Tax=Scopulibacillus cellulosilyticus TaxID=2665665 RepID=A0ABW2PXP0_9BACL